MICSPRKQKGGCASPRTGDYCSTLLRLLRSTAVTQITFDEAHSGFLSEQYRPTMHALVHIREATALRVFLTATLSPAHESVLADSVGISLSRTLTLRSPTARFNHRIQVVSVPRPDTPFSVGLRLASLLLGNWKEDPKVRGIIFVRSIEKLQDLSSSCPFEVCTYHGSMIEDQKELQLSWWVSDDHPAKWIISTTALIHGVDYPRVDAVIFLEMPFGLYDFVQGAGRGGRCGQEALIAILHNGVSPPLESESPYGFREELGKVLTLKTCRRATISTFMDGEVVSCSDLPRSLHCDFCDGKIYPLLQEALNTTACQPVTHIPVHTPLPTPPNSSPGNISPIQPAPEPNQARLLRGLTAQANAKSRKEHAQFTRGLMERYGGCFACRIASDEHLPCHQECGSSGFSGCSLNRHQPFTCTKFKHRMGWIDWRKNHIKWPKDTGRCHFCGLPHAVADRSHKPNGTTYPGMCWFSDAAIVAAWHILNTPDLFENLQMDMSFVPGSDPPAEFGCWLSEYGSASQEIRLLSVFSWLCRQYYPKDPLLAKLTFNVDFGPVPNGTTNSCG